MEKLIIMQAFMSYLHTYNLSKITSLLVLDISLTNSIKHPNICFDNSNFTFYSCIVVKKCIL